MMTLGHEILLHHYVTNAFLYVAPIYSGARAFIDFRETRTVWAVLGSLAAATLLIPNLITFFTDSEASAWSMLGVVIVGSWYVSLYSIARTFLDLREKRFVWAVLGALNTILLLIPTISIFIPRNSMMIG